MFSSTAEYALRAMVHLVTHQEALCGSQAIAAETKVPPRYLSKILNDLVEAGLITSRRGPSGGFLLARDPGTISVLEVVNAVDPIKRILSCPLNIPSHKGSLCRLHRKLDDTIGLVESALASATITEMAKPSSSGNLCAFPSPAKVTLRTTAPRAPKAARGKPTGPGRAGRAGR